MRRILLTVAALLIPASGLSLGLAAGTASAGTGKITCTTLSGNATGNLTISGCTGGNTGGSSVAQPATALATGGTTHWVSGSTTTMGSPTLTTVAATHCPGYVKGAATNPAASSFTATVTGDTGDGIFLPGAAVGAVCVGTDGSITALKPLKISWIASNILCTGMTGTGTGNVALNGCTGGNTGGGSVAQSATVLANGGTLHWLSGGSLVLGTPVLTSTSATHCPGYVKKAASEPIAYKILTPVTADTGDGLKLPGTMKGAVCVGNDVNLTVTALKPFLIK